MRSDDTFGAGCRFGGAGCGGFVRLSEEGGCRPGRSRGVDAANHFTVSEQLDRANGAGADRPPFEASSAAEAIVKVLREEPPSLRQLDPRVSAGRPLDMFVYGIGRGGDQGPRGIGRGDCEIDGQSIAGIPAGEIQPPGILRGHDRPVWLTYRRLRQGLLRGFGGRISRGTS